MSKLHAFVNASTAHDQWNTPSHIPCGECGVPFKDHGSFGKFEAPTLDEVLCQDITCPQRRGSTTFGHTLGDHVP